MKTWDEFKDCRLCYWNLFLFFLFTYKYNNMHNRTYTAEVNIWKLIENRILLRANSYCWSSGMACWRKSEWTENQICYVLLVSQQSWKFLCRNLIVRISASHHKRSTVWFCLLISWYKSYTFGLYITCCEC